MALREPQTAEQLVEVPTILYFLKQKVDIPVPRRGTRFSHQGQSFVVILVGGADRSLLQVVVEIMEVFKVFLPRHGTLKRTAEQIADIPVPGGLGQDFPPGVQSAALSAVSPKGPNQGFFFFRTFLSVKPHQIG